MRPARSSVRRTLVSVAAMGLLPLVLTACSSSATSSTSTTTATTRSLCTEVQPAQIAAATGLKVSPAQATATKTTLTCTYKGTDLSKSVIILYGIDVTSAEFTSQAKKANAAHGPITHVSHLGDAAYYFTVSAPGRRTITTLVLVHGQAEIVITSTASVGHLVDLATQILTIFSAKA